jgi:ABC-2 type transport system permease protein
MAGLSAKDQFATVLWLRWRIFINGLRSRRGQAEAVSGIVSFIAMLSFGFGPSIGFAIGSFYDISSGHHQILPILCWITFLYWQFAPAISIAVSDTFDASTLLRFPVSLPMYYTLWLTFGSFDPALIVPMIWLCGMLVGIACAKVALLPWAAFVVFCFALVNLLLSRLITAYLEKWLAKRKTRELVGALLAFLGIGIQFLMRAIDSLTGGHSTVLRMAARIQNLIPPGMTARAIEFGSRNHFTSALEQIAFLGGYGLLFAAVLGVRLRKQYLGENLSETSRRSEPEKRERVAPVSRGWLALPDPIGAVFEKELRTLLGARQIWIIMIASPLLLIAFGKVGPGQASWGRSEWALPVGAAYGLFTLAQFFCNAFAGEQGGIQFLYLAPVRFRHVMVAKNLAHTCIYAAQFLLILATVTFLFIPPRLSLLALTLAAISFGLLANLAAGNLLSLYFPKKVDFGRMNSRQGSSTSGLIMLGFQLVVIAIAAPVFLVARQLDSDWLGSAALLVLAALMFTVYWVVLGKVDQIAIKKRETLIAEFTKAV